MSYSLNQLRRSQRRNRITPMGDDGSAATAQPKKLTLSDVTGSPLVKTGAGVAMLYHGYKRNNSIFWALVWGAMGKWEPLITVPIAIAQGFGQKKTCP